MIMRSTTPTPAPTLGQSVRQARNAALIDFALLSPFVGPFIPPAAVVVFWLYNTALHRMVQDSPLKNCKHS